MLWWTHRRQITIPPYCTLHFLSFISSAPSLYILSLWCLSTDTQLTLCKNLPSLVTVAMSDKPCRSHTTHHVLTQRKYITEQRGTWKHANRQDRAGYFWYETMSQLSNVAIFFKEIQTINTVLWLFNMSWQIEAQFKRHVNRSSFHIYLKHEINMNEHWKVFYFNRRKMSSSSLSPLS